MQRIETVIEPAIPMSNDFGILAPSAFKCEDTPMAQLDLADRYGRGRNYTFPIALIISILGIGWLIWAGGFHAKPEIKTTVIAYDAKSPKAIELTFEVSRKDESKVFTCVLTGTDVNHFIVGEIQRKIQPGERLITVSIPTRSTAAFAKVVRCTS